jgi:hypothetical protein
LGRAREKERGKKRWAAAQGRERRELSLLYFLVLLFFSYSKPNSKLILNRV